MVLQFHEEQGDTIHIAYDVSPTAIQCSMHLQLTHTQELVFLRRSKVNNLCLHLFRLDIRLGASYSDTITNQLILLFVNLHQCLRAHVFRHALHALLQLLFI